MGLGAFPSSHMTHSLAPAPFKLQVQLSSPLLYVWKGRIKRAFPHFSSLCIHHRAINRHKRHWHCVSSLATTFIDVEKLRIPSLEDHSTSAATAGSLTYTGSIGPPVQTSFGATLATETFLTGKEALIPVAAAEAVSLAKAAVEAAKNAAMMSFGDTFAELDDADDFPSEGDILLLERARPIEVQPEEENISHHSTKDTENSNGRESELELLQGQLSKRIAARSGRRTERKAKREKAAEKTISDVVSVKSGSSSRKKHISAQEIDYSDPLHYLRSTTNTTKLLTATEEIELSEGIQGLLKLEKLHEELAEHGGQPTIAQWASVAGLDRKTLRERVNYGIHCKERMIKSNIRLVISIAKNYQGVGMNLEDLVQEGCRGLVKGCEKFDASKGFKFSTYAHWWIKQSIRKALSEQSRTIRIPYHIADAAYRVKEARKRLYSKNGRHPDNDEIAEATGLSLKRLMTILLTPKAPRSFDQKTGIDQTLKPSEVTADPEAETPEDVLTKQLMKKDLEKVLDNLNSREKQVIRSRFGLDDGRMKTLQEIGESMGVSRERIRQIESCAFRKLKNKKRIENLKQYLIS
eukprot:TRINITY_DN3185_c0_g2_i3.p1 TRINITY_DN3185_c0_g2~~TRINITY_DN3185_c0_g2_i3.p1  ORF type:complete len:579 (-),score=134.27 TRINITY_DN3185_c0_g2_i3:226-1962(-)